MEIPKKIKAYGLTYNIKLKKQVKDKEGKWDGLIHHRKCIIELNKTLKKERVEKNLFHEITHLIACESDIKLTEHKVELISNGFYSILKDNKLLKR